MDNIEEIEIWKNIPGWEGFYQASSFGRIKSLDRIIPHGRGYKYTVRGMLLKAQPWRRGYLQVRLLRSGTGITCRVHQLVAICFMGHVPDGHTVVVDHKNNIKTDNRLCNLQITTSRHNNTKDKLGKSGYTGAFENPCGTFTAKIRTNGKTTHLGVFETAEAAGDAYHEAVRGLKEGVFPIKRWVPESGYFGVRRTKQDTFQVVVTTKDKTHYFGTYEDAVVAARVYDRKAIELNGLNITTNFPKHESVLDLPEYHVPPKAYNRKMADSGFKGVYAVKDRFRATIWNDGTKVLIGYFNTMEEAGRAYDRRALEVKGPNTYTNFPISDYTT